MPCKPLMSGELLVECSQKEYNQLVRDSEKLAVLKTLFATQKFVTCDEVRAILGINEENK